MTRPFQVLINSSALGHNLSIVRKHAPRARIMAVIKANAYGHGLLCVAEAISSVDGFAMLELDAAIRLREAGYSQTILLIEGFFSPKELALCEQYHLSTVIHHSEQLEMLPVYKRRGGLDVFLKLNTGMNRLGFTPEQFSFALRTLQSNATVGQITLMSHFSCADEINDKAEVLEQLKIFNHTAAGKNLPRSLANSAAILHYPETHVDWVRPGIMLYGASPFTHKTSMELDLLPVMTVSSKIIAIQNLKTGDRVGYGHAFQANQPMRVGIIAGGYADGYPRSAPTGTPVLVNGRRTRTLGRISMDMLHIDLSGIENAGVGSSVVLWGDGIPVEEIAQSAGTVNYELLCAIQPRM